MSKNSETPINIMLSSNNSEKSESEKFIIYENYLVSTNQKLIDANTDLLVKIKELEGQIDLKEEDIDKLENSMRYLKSLLTNLNENRNNYKQLNNLIIQTNEIYLKYSKDVQDTFKIISMYSCILVFLGTWIILNLYFANRKIITVSMCLLPIIYKIYYKIHENITKLDNLNKKIKESTNSLNQKIKEKKNDIKIIEDSCLTLDNWINEV